MEQRGAGGQWIGFSWRLERIINHHPPPPTAIPTDCVAGLGWPSPRSTSSPDSSSSSLLSLCPRPLSRSSSVLRRPKLDVAAAAVWRTKRGVRTHDHRPPGRSTAAALVGSVCRRRLVPGDGCHLFIYDRQTDRAGSCRPACSRCCVAAPRRRRSPWKASVRSACLASHLLMACREGESERERLDGLAWSALIDPRRRLRPPYRTGERPTVEV